MLKSVGKLFGLRRKPPPPKARIDRQKTRVNKLDEMLDDSDEGSYHSTTSVSSDESEYRESNDNASYGSDSSYRPKRDSGREDDEEEASAAAASSSSNSSSSDTRGKKSSAVPRGRRRKRAASAAALEDDSSSNSSSGSSSDSSDVGAEPRRKVLQKKRLKLQDSEDEALKQKRRETELKKAKEAAAKRRERKSKLMELARRRKTGTRRRSRRSRGSEEEEEKEEEEGKKEKAEDKEKADDSEDSSSEKDPNPLMDSSEEEKLADTDSLKDFIVEEEEQKKAGDEEGDEEDVGEPKGKDFLSHLPRQFITGSQLTHFQVVVKALLINALDSSFLKSLYNGERTKRYAQEMKSSLHHFDERLVLPRLENLKQRSRWKERYKERVECYPKVRISMVNVHTKGCEACELHRNGRFSVRLSGQLYHCDTLQEDQFMPDDSQTFLVGSVCASRTEVYHALKHFKYHLFERCRTALDTRKEVQEQDEGEDDEPVKDTVNKVFTKLQEEGWITKQYNEFEEHLNAADFFQEEKLD